MTTSTCLTIIKFIKDPNRTDWKSTESKTATEERVNEIYKLTISWLDKLFNLITGGWYGTNLKNRIRKEIKWAFDYSKLYLIKHSNAEALQNSPYFKKNELLLLRQENLERLFAPGEFDVSWAKFTRSNESWHEFKERIRDRLIATDPLIFQKNPKQVQFLSRRNQKFFHASGKPKLDLLARSILQELFPNRQIACS